MGGKTLTETFGYIALVLAVYLFDQNQKRKFIKRYTHLCSLFFYIFYKCILCYTLGIPIDEIKINIIQMHVLIHHGEVIILVLV